MAVRRDWLDPAVGDWEASAQALFVSIIQYDLTVLNQSTFSLKIFFGIFCLMTTLTPSEHAISRGTIFFHALFDL